MLEVKRLRVEKFFQHKETPMFLFEKAFLLMPDNLLPAIEALMIETDQYGFPDFGRRREKKCYWTKCKQW
jgi:hypothetical protein